MSGNRKDLALVAGRLPICHHLHQSLDDCGVPQGAAIVVAVSGGADSMALLALLAALAKRGRVSPIAAHVDHGLREGSAAEGEHVAALAASLGVPMMALTIEIAGKSNLSARARKARYSALLNAAAAHDAAWLATAHHADDQLETIIMALARGTGLARIAGMKPVRKLAVGVALIRPLLGVPRLELVATCRALGVTWCEDPSNAKTTTPRGAVRHRVVPVLESVWPGASERTPRTAAMLRWAAGALTAEAKSLLACARTPDSGASPLAGGATYRRSVLRKAPLPVLAEMVKRSIGESCPGAVVWSIALAVRDGESKPRQWRVGRKTVVKLNSRTYSTTSLPLRQRS
jgi:tRNA(Ile)-lysidine synthetase-like protein